MNYNYKCIVSNTGNKRYYKRVGGKDGKWKRIKNDIGTKAEKNKRVYKTRGDVIISETTPDVYTATIEGVSKAGLDPETYFTIYNSNSMSIEVNEWHQGFGYARKMMIALIERLKADGKISNDTILEIDTDAGEGFWEHIGLLEYNDWKILNSGAEMGAPVKRITLQLNPRNASKIAREKIRKLFKTR